MAAAILLFAGIETYLFSSGLAVPMAQAMLELNWLLILGAFMVVGCLATHVAHTVESKPLQYVALVGFVVAQAIIFMPMLAIAITLQPGVFRRDDRLCRYDTSNIPHHYTEDRYVGAALQLFASIALMFWYVLRLFMSRD